MTCAVTVTHAHLRTNRRETFISYAPAVVGATPPLRSILGRVKVVAQILIRRPTAVLLSRVV
jgi:hypothetical protein